MSDSEKSAAGNVTRLLMRYSDGDSASLDAIIPIVYRELKTLAAQQLGRVGDNAQLQATALVHEAYEKLTVGAPQRFNDRRHFFAIASRAMRQIIVDSYRANSAAKRGGNFVATALLSSSLQDHATPERIVALDQAIERLAKESPELAEVVELSCFAGLSNIEIAEISASTVRTVQRKLLRAQAWIGHLADGSKTE